MSLSATASSGQIAALLAAEGETGGLIAAHDWSATALGAIEAWPQSLMTAVTLMIHSSVPMVMLWGVDGVMLYNDGYSRFAGGRHPQLLGAKVREGWPEVAEFNDHVMRVVLAGGTLAYRDQELALSRNGVPEPVWMNLDYSPVHDERGIPAGVIAIVVETTERVLAERRSAGEREQLARMFEQAPTFMAMLSGPEADRQPRRGRPDAGRVAARRGRAGFPRAARQGVSQRQGVHRDRRGAPCAAAPRRAVVRAACRFRLPADPRRGGQGLGDLHRRRRRHPPRGRRCRAARERGGLSLCGGAQPARVLDRHPGRADRPHWR